MKKREGGRLPHRLWNELVRSQHYVCIWTSDGEVWNIRVCTPEEILFCNEITDIDSDDDDDDDDDDDGGGGNVGGDDDDDVVCK